MLVRRDILVLLAIYPIVSAAQASSSISVPAASSSTFLSIVTSISQTKIWINEVADYSKLSKCVEYPISVIMRDMSSGCGDGGRLTSYTCFCTESYTKMTSFLLIDVISRCIDDVGTAEAGAQGASAQNVFYQYCQLGVQRGLVPASTTATRSQATASASPAAGASMASPSETGASSNSEENDGGIKRSTATAAGISISILGFAMGLIVSYIIWRRRRRNKRKMTVVQPEKAELDGTSKPRVELTDGERTEMEGSGKPREMEAHDQPKELPDAGTTHIRSAELAGTVPLYELPADERQRDGAH